MKYFLPGKKRRNKEREGKKKKEGERKRKERRKEGRKVGRKITFLRLVDRASILGGVCFLDSA